MSNLQDDIGAAIVATIQAASSRFTSLASPGGTIACEYRAEDNTNMPAGAYGRCIVTPVAEDPVPGTEYDESCESAFVYDLVFALSAKQTSHTSRSAIYQAVHGTFRDRGAEALANLTDNGSNRLGSSGVIEVGDLIEEPSAPDAPVFRVRLTVFMWHKVPMA